MKILLTTLNAKYIHSSLALRYLQAFSRREFPGITLEEFTINDHPGEIAGEIYKHGPTIVGFSCYIWNIDQTLAIAAIIKKVSPGTVILLGGPEVSYDPEEILAEYPFVDYVISGEGEVPFREFLRTWRARGDWSRVPSLSYRQGDRIFTNARAPLLSPLDQIPSPYEGELAALANKIVYYESSRGCPFACQYCLSSTLPGVRFFSLERVKRDLDRLLRAGVRQIKFVDRTFNCRKDHALAIMKFLTENRGETNFHFEVAADLLDEEMLEFLAGVPDGLFQFEIGVQSTNPHTLALISRQMNLSRVRRNVAQLRRQNNILLHLDLIAGLPGENYASFRRSFNDVYALEPHRLQLGFLKLLKGSGLRKRYREEGYRFLNRPPYEVLAGKDLSYAELLRLKTIEDLVEKYANSQRFSHALDYLIRSHFPTPFDFFEEFGAYWEERGYHRLAHSAGNLYRILGEFYETRGFANRQRFYEILKFDYVLHEPGAKLLPIFRRREEANFRDRVWLFLKNRENLEAYLPHLASLPAKEIMKKIRFENFALEEETTYLFDYSSVHPVTGEAKYHRVTI